MQQEQNLFQGQVVVITGGSSGIGAAAAAAFSRCGATVYITGRSPQKLESQIGTMAQQGLVMSETMRACGRCTRRCCWRMAGSTLS